LQQTLSQLLEEHQLIRKVASALEWLSLRFGSSSLVDEDFLASLNVLLDYIISCHHSKEEAILFPRLTALGGDLADLVKRALEDHSAFASLTQRLRDSITEGSLSGASEAAGPYRHSLRITSTGRRQYCSPRPRSCLMRRPRRR